MARCAIDSGWLGTLAIAVTACASGNADEAAQPLLAYDRAPIVYGAYDPPGTFLWSLDDPTPRKLNDIYYYYPIAVSPARTRVMQVADGVIEVHALGEAGSRLASFASPGQFVGWNGEDTLLFASWRTEGLTRLSIDSGAVEEMAFPGWVTRESNGPLGLALSPDAEAAAFLVWTQDPSIISSGFAVFVVDTVDGSVLAQWPVDGDVFPGRIIWAKDGTIVYYSFAQAVIMTVSIGDAAFSEPVTLPFQPCDAAAWVTPDVLHMSEGLVAGDHGTCAGSWLVDTDGRHLVRRDAAPPAAISPDGRKILLVGALGELTIADPDGSNPTPLSGIPAAHGVAW